MAPKTPAQKKASEKWEKKYKQRIIRLTPEKDKLLTEMAKKKNISINTLINDALDYILNKE